jgi:hypothetical protein
MHARRNCTLIVVKPRNRKGYMPSPMLARAVKEAQRRGVQIEEQVVAARGSEPRPVISHDAGVARLQRLAQARPWRNLQGEAEFHAESKKSFAARGQLGDGPWERVT